MEPVTRSRQRNDSEEKDPILDMSSLIDVSFLLLIYFLVTSTLDPKESDLGMTMPGSAGGISPGIDPMEIEVDASGRIIVNEEIIDHDSSNRELPLLKDRLITYVNSAELLSVEPVVLIRADDASKGQRFVDVLNALAHEKVGIKNVTIAGFVED